MPTVTENIELARQERAAANEFFRNALQAGRDFGLSWAELAKLAGMSIGGVRWHLRERGKDQ